MSRTIYLLVIGAYGDYEYETFTDLAAAKEAAALEEGREWTHSAADGSEDWYADRAPTWERTASIHAVPLTGAVIE